MVESIALSPSSVQLISLSVLTTDIWAEQELRHYLHALSLREAIIHTNLVYLKNFPRLYLFSRKHEVFFFMVKKMQFLKWVLHLNSDI